MATKQEDTQPLAMEDIPTRYWEPLVIPEQKTYNWPPPVAWSQEEPDISEFSVAALKSPEPALLRGLIMSVTGLSVLVAFRGHEVVEAFLWLGVGLGPLGLSLWIRKHVTPAVKLRLPLRGEW